MAWKGKWVALDPETLKQITQVIQASRGAGFESMSRGEALAAALTGTARIPGVSEAIEVEAAGDFGAALEELKVLPDRPITQPAGLQGPAAARTSCAAWPGWTGSTAWGWAASWRTIWAWASASDPIPRWWSTAL